MQKGPRRRTPIVEMNLIPLIDVSLILVIIFMILTPVLVQHQLTVRLPSSTQGQTTSAEKTVEVSIDRKGRITVDGLPVKLARLEVELVMKLGKASKKSLLVQADRTVSIEKVVQVLDIAKKLQVGKLGIGVLQEQ